MEALAAGVDVFDVFCSHHGQDTADVERVATQLRVEGFVPWLDTWYLTPGRDWQLEISEALRSSRACAVFLGGHGLGPWAEQEARVAADRAAHERDFRLFLVLLPGAPIPESSDLDFLRTRTWVDLREGIADSEGFHDLVRAVTGVPRRPPELPKTNGAICPYRGLKAFDETTRSSSSGARTMSRASSSSFDTDASSPCSAHQAAARARCCGPACFSRFGAGSCRGATFGPCVR